MYKEDIKKFYFSEIVAKEVGVEEAIMFSNIYFWTDLNRRKKSEHHLHGDKYWMYCTVREFTERYSFWTSSKIRRILKNLIEKKYIEVGRFNKFGYDKTKWYTIAQNGTKVAKQDKEFVENINSFSGE